MIIIPKKLDAIRVLVGGGVSGPTDGSNTVFHRGQTPPTEKEIEDKLQELQAAEPMRVMREQRDQSLKETDVYMVTDHPTSKADEWKTYRQELRDMPSKETPLLQPDGSLSNVTWPTKPE